MKLQSSGYFVAAVLSVSVLVSLCWLLVHALVGYPRNWWQGLGQDFNRFELVRGCVCLLLFAALTLLGMSTVLARCWERKTSARQVRLSAATATCFSVWAGITFGEMVRLIGQPQSSMGQDLILGILWATGAIAFAVATARLRAPRPPQASTHPVPFRLWSCYLCGRRLLANEAETGVCFTCRTTEPGGEQGPVAKPANRPSGATAESRDGGNDPPTERREQILSKKTEARTNRLDSCLPLPVSLLFVSMSCCACSPLGLISLPTQITTHEPPVTDRALTRLRETDQLHLLTKATADRKRPNSPEEVATLDLSHTPVTDAGLRELAPLKNLTTLNLSHTPVTDAGLRELAALKHLTTLRLSHTPVTDGGIAELEQALPKCKVVK